MASIERIMSREEMLRRYRYYQARSAASNTIITTKPAKQCFAEIVQKMEHDEAIEEITLEYNLGLLEGKEPMSEEEMAEIMEVREVEDLQKDDEIALLKQSINHLERENEALRAGLRSVVYDKKMSVAYGVNWKGIRDEAEVLQKPQDGKLEGCVEARKVRKDG